MVHSLAHCTYDVSHNVFKYHCMSTLEFQWLLKSVYANSHTCLSRTRWQSDTETKQPDSDLSDFRFNFINTSALLAFSAISYSLRLLHKIRL